MISQIWAEIKKIIKNPWIWLVFIAVLFINHGCSSSLDRMKQYQGLSDEKELLEGKQAYWYMQEIGKEYEGVMDEAWFIKLEDDYTSALRAYLLANADISKMQEVYGDTWLDDMIKQKGDIAGHYLEQKDQETLPFVNTETPEVALRYTFLSSLRSQYAHIIETKAWNHIGDENDVIKTMLNQEDTFYYGNSDGWKALIDLLSNSYFLFAMLLILISSNLFNKEKNMQMMEVIRTSKYGKQKCAIAKMTAVTLTSWLFVLLLFVVETLYIGFTMGLGNWQVHAMASLDMLTPFTFQQLYFYAIGLYVFTAFIIVQTCSLLSCLIKSSYLSLLLSTAVIVLPDVLPGRCFSLFPIRVMKLKNSLLNESIITIHQNMYFIKDIVFIWIIPVLVFIFICYTYYKSYRFLNE